MSTEHELINQLFCQAHSTEAAAETIGLAHGAQLLTEEFDSLLTEEEPIRNMGSQEIMDWHKERAIFHAEITDGHPEFVAKDHHKIQAEKHKKAAHTLLDYLQQHNELLARDRPVGSKYLKAKKSS
jgi:hypothetical protein